MGAGIYRVGDRTVQVYRLPLKYGVRRVESHPWGLLLQMPVTFGLRSTEFFEAGLSENVQSVSVVPGVVFDVPVRDNWRLLPFVDLGAGKDLEGGDVSIIYSAGLKSLVEFPGRRFDSNLSNTLLYAGYDVPGSKQTGDFVKLETSVGLRFPLKLTLRGLRTDILPYATNYLFFDKLEVRRQNAGPLEISLQWEVGVTFGTRERLKIGILRIPRVGIGYRFGDRISAIRLVFGGPFRHAPVGR